MGRKADLWKGHMEAWGRSGLTQAGYCREHELSLASFGYWRRRLRASAHTKSDRSALVPIMVNEMTTPAQVIEVRLPNGLSVHLPLAMDSAHWLPIIQALRTC